MTVEHKENADDNSAHSGEINGEHPFADDDELRNPDAEDKMKMATAWQVLSFIEDPKDKALFLIGCTFSMVSGCVVPGTAYRLSSSFSELAGTSSYDETGGMEKIREIAYFFIVLGSIALISSTIQVGCLEVVATRSMKTFTCRWFEALLRQDQAYFDVYDVAGLASSIGPNAKKFRRGIGAKFGEGIQCITITVLSIAFALYSSWKLSLMVVAIIPFITTSGLMVMKNNESRSERAAIAYTKAGSVAYSTISSIRTVLSLNAIPEMLRQYCQATLEAYRFSTGTLWRQGFVSGTMLASIILLCIVITLFGSFLMYDEVRENGCDPSNGVPGVDTCSESGQGVLGALLGITFAAQCMSVMVSASQSFTAARIACYPAILVMNRKSSSNSAEKKQIKLDSPKSDQIQEEIKGDEEEGTTVKEGLFLPSSLKIDSFSPAGLKPGKIEGAISFRDVFFWYPTRPNHLVFNGFTLDVMPGTTAALVGPSGGGKSTAITLLERFYDPISGSVCLDGIDIKNMNVKYLRSQLGYVGQEPTLFDTTIADNIKYGNPGATIEDIIEAAKASNAHDFIMSFPNGYDTKVGNNGAQLSGGQKQRIAIARVLVSDPKILLLDEATSALDSESELVVQQALDDLLTLRKRTTIVIAHRLSTIHNVDRIVFVSDGRVVEAGTHEELMRVRAGNYRRLVEEQEDVCEESLSDSSHDDDTITSLDNHIASKETMDRPSPSLSHLSFKNVSFSYPARAEKQIFHDFCLDVRRGETLALVGPSGGGKSTTFALIERFYDPNEGAIEFEGVNAKELNVYWLRDQIGYVEQEPTLFNATIAENIAYGFPEATQERIEEVAKIVNCHDFIMKFPRGYDTVVGVGGSQLSGGQKQRIAIARAIVKNPKILLLDEATSALDNQSEAVVQESLGKLMSSSDITTIVIAHRLSTIRSADRVAFISNGIVKEIGPHDDLMNTPNSRYRRLVETQRRSSMIDIGLAKPDDVSLRETEEATGSDVKKDSTTIDSNGENSDIRRASYLKRARDLSKPDLKFLLMGGVGALFAGAVFPVWGVLFGLMIELLFQRVLPCPGSGQFDPLSMYNVQNCEEYYDWVAENMQEKSFELTGGFLSIAAATLLGNTLLYLGFGVAGERLNKRIRDSAFQSLVCQEVAYFDKHSITSITSQLQNDTSKMHAFSIEPIRTSVANFGTVFIGLAISFFFMWPFALVTLFIVPFLAFAAILRMRTMVGTDQGNDAAASTNDSSGGIAVETLLNIRTVAALGMERAKYDEYAKAVQAEDPNLCFESFKSGAMNGLGWLINQWSNALQIWWGGWLMYNYRNVFDFQDFVISMFCLKLSLMGLGTTSKESSDQKESKEAAERIFHLIDRESAIDPLSVEGLELY